MMIFNVLFLHSMNAGSSSLVPKFRACGLLLKAWNMFGFFFLVDRREVVKFATSLGQYVWVFFFFFCL